MKLSASALIVVLGLPLARAGQDPEAKTVPDLTAAVSLAISPDGKSLAVVYSPSVGKGALGIWSVPDLKELRKIPSVPFGLTSLTYSPDGKTLLGAGLEPKLLVWNADDGKELASVTLPEGMLGMQVSPDGKSVLAPGDPVRVLEVSTGKERGTIKPGGLSVAFQPGTRMVAVAGGRSVKFWDMDSWKESRSLDVMAFQLAFSPDGKMLATGLGPQGVNLVDAESGKAIRTFKEDRPPPMARFEFCSEGKILVKVNMDQTVSYFEVATGKVLRKIKTPGTDNFKAHSLRLTPDGKTIAWVTSERPSTVKVIRLD